MAKFLQSLLYETTGSQRPQLSQRRGGGDCRRYLRGLATGATRGSHESSTTILRG